MSEARKGYKPQEAKQKRVFEVLSYCQTLDAQVCNATVKADKGHRLTLIKYTQELCHELIHVTRRANSKPVGSSERIMLMEQGFDLVECIIDMLPVLCSTRCITIGEMGQIDKFAGRIKYSYSKWMEKTGSSSNK